MSRFFSRLKLRVKFSIMIVGLVIFIMGSVLILVFSLVKDSITKEVHSRANDLITVLVVAGAQELMGNSEFIVLQNLVDGISQAEEVQQAMVFNADSVIAHNWASKIGTKLDDPHSLYFLRSSLSDSKSYLLNGKRVLDTGAPIFVSGQKKAVVRVIISMAAADKAVGEAAIEIGILGVISTFIALLLAAYLSGLIIKPLNQLYHAAERFSQGDREVDVQVTAKDELGVLQKDMAAMIKEIRLKERLATLGTTTAQLAHEIRSPLTIITKNLHRLDSYSAQDSKEKELHQIILGEVNRLVNLVKQLLAFSKESQLLYSRTQINNVIDQVIYLIADQMKARGIDCQKDLEELPVISADKGRLQSVFRNLLSNAIEAMPEGGTLYIRTQVGKKTSQSFIWLNGGDSNVSSSIQSGRAATSTDQGHDREKTERSLGNRFFSFFVNQARRLFVDPERQIKNTAVDKTTADLNKDAIVITIADSGVGIPAKLRDRVFMPFFTTKRDGHGLGLALSHKIIQEHGGTIRVKSEEGKGTTFIITLPILGE